MAYILFFIQVQMRWDGTIGFPGGFIKSREDVAKGLNRELAEEMNVKSKDLTITNDDFMMAHLTSKFSFYLFTKEISAELFMTLEANSLAASDFGKEVTKLPKCLLK